MSETLLPARLLDQLHRKVDLTSAEARTVAEALIAGTLAEADAKGLLVALAAKGESIDELLAFAQALRHHATPFLPELTGSAVDLCGTGGAARPTFNVSTVSAFVVAAAGVSVVKHGNASSRGSCGSSDLLEALGLPIRTSIAFAEASYRQARLAFLHAPLYHTATRGVARLRRELGIRTIFNQLGPLTNPSGARSQVVGCFSAEYAAKAAVALARLGILRSLTAHGMEGTDEFSPEGPTQILFTSQGRTTSETVQAGDLLRTEERTGPWASLPPADAAAEAYRILEGGAGSTRGSVLLTSGAALWVQGQVGSLSAGVQRAREVLDSGAAREKMLFLQALSRERDWS